MLNFKLLKLSIQDYFTKDVLKLIVYPLFGSAIVMFILFFSVTDIWII